MQIEKLHKRIDELQAFHGDKKLSAIYGAGCVKRPEIMFIFMNPTGKNISACKNWRGLRAPWLGTKNIWTLFFRLGILSEKSLGKIKESVPEEWSESFAAEIYREVAKNRVYITNLAKCTQIDARPLKNSVFKNYLDLTYEEILAVNPKKIITFGNQVSSVLLNKPVSVSQYKNRQKEILTIGRKSFDVYPVYYPVGQGQRNMPLAIERIRTIIELCHLL